MPYPVNVSVEPALKDRDRVTVAFRIILAIPHLILVGGVGLGLSMMGGSRFSLGAGTDGLLGFVAGCLAIVSWFTIVIAGTHIAGIRDFTAYFLRWRTRTIAYLMLFRDEYPPFGDGPYPASLDIVDPVEPRDRLTVAFRLILGIPHFIVLAFLGVAWCLTTIIAWFFLVISGEYPDGLYRFGVGVLRWDLRVHAYMLLMVDEYPPFSLDE